MSKLKVLPYKSFSKSAKDIVRSLSPRAIMKKQTTQVIGRKLLLNWGHSSPLFSLLGVNVLNKPEAVRIASNKLLALNKMKDAGVQVPEYTTDMNVAKSWVQDDERYIVCRKLLRANSGRGIVLAKVVTDVVVAPLYTKYVRKGIEYRVHIFRGEVIDFVQKKKRLGFATNPLFDKYIRSYEKGWIMSRENVILPDDVKVQAIKAVQSIGLDFGAVDIVVSSYNNKAYVLEVNSAPGVQGTTLVNYKRAIERWMNEV